MGRAGFSRKETWSALPGPTSSTKLLCRDAPTLCWGSSGDAQDSRQGGGGSAGVQPGQGADRQSVGFLGERGFPPGPWGLGSVGLRWVAVETATVKWCGGCRGHPHKALAGAAPSSFRMPTFLSKQVCNPWEQGSPHGCPVPLLDPTHKDTTAAGAPGPLPSKEWLGLASKGPSTLLGHLPLVGAHRQAASISSTPESGDTLYFAGSLWGERRALHWVLFLPT